MSSQWKKPLIIVTVLLLISIAALITVYSSGQAKIKETQSRLDAANYALDLVIEKVTSQERELAADKSKLAEMDQTLTDKNRQLADKEQELETVNARLAEKTSDLSTSTLKLLLATSENEKMEAQYTSLRSKILSRAGYTKQDRQKSITPDDSAVASKVKEITGGYNGSNDKLWADYKKMYQWIDNNIEYSYDSYIPILSTSVSDQITWKGEFWRTPAETLKDKAGDCEDQALLLVSMMRNYNNKTYGEWVITLASKTPGEPGHVAVAFPVSGGKLTILDPAGHYYTGMERGYLSSDTISGAINKWLAHWAKEMPDAYVDEVFSETLDEAFTSTAEFVTWAGKQ